MSLRTYDAPVFIDFGQQTNRAAWGCSFQLMDDGEVIPDGLDTAQIEFGLKQYGSLILSASIGKYITLDTATGDWSFDFPASVMRGLCLDTYEVGATMTRNGTTDQLFIGSVSIIDGVTR